jgi:hypothetical protein
MFQPGRTVSKKDPKIIALSYSITVKKMMIVKISFKKLFFLFGRIECFHWHHNHIVHKSGL